MHTMTPEIYFHTDLTALTHYLKNYLPYSLPLLRRFQFCSFPGGRTENSKLLSSFPPSSLETSSIGQSKCFIFAYLDFSRGPETEMWIFSSLELYQGENDTNKAVLTSEEEELCRQQVLAMFGKLKEIEAEYVESEVGIERGKREAAGVVNCGTLHECIVDIVEKKGLLVRKTVPTLKFVSNIKDLVPVPDLPQNLKWGTVSIEDIEWVLTKTVIRRKLRTLILLPSAAVVDEKTGSLVSWAFLGVDGSLTHLYTENAYRGLGLAKAVSVKLYHESIPRYGDDGLTHADVEIQNMSSQGVAKSLGGVHKWTVHWTWIRFSGV